MTAWVLIYYIAINGRDMPFFSPVLANKGECERLMRNLDFGGGWSQRTGSCQQILIPK